MKAMMLVLFLLLLLVYTVTSGGPGESRTVHPTSPIGPPKMGTGTSPSQFLPDVLNGPLCPKPLFEQTPIGTDPNGCELNLPICAREEPSCIVCCWNAGNLVLSYTGVEPVWERAPDGDTICWVYYRDDLVLSWADLVVTPLRSMRSAYALSLSECWCGLAIWIADELGAQILQSRENYDPFAPPSFWWTFLHPSDDCHHE